jgi:hypothetical protein
LNGFISILAIAKAVDLFLRVVGVLECSVFSFRFLGVFLLMLLVEPLLLEILVPFAEAFVDFLFFALAWPFGDLNLGLLKRGDLVCISLCIYYLIVYSFSLISLRIAFR